MKKYLLKTVIVFFACVLSLNAQEKGKVHLKIIKEENGKVVEIDTVFEGTDFDGMHFYGDISIDELNIDSILKEFKIDDHKGFKFITLSDEIHMHDSLKHIWLTVDADIKGDSVKMKKHVYFSKDGDKKLIKCKEGMVWIASDSVAMKNLNVDDASHAYFMTHTGGKKMKIIAKSSGESMVWSTDNAGNINISDDGKVIIYKTGDSTFDILKSENDDNILIEEIIIKKSDNKEKTFEIYVTEDGDDTKVKIKNLEGDFEHDGENVKIYKYKTDDGKIVIKAEITDSELCKEDKEKLKEFGIEDNNELNLKKIKIYPNPSDGKFKLEFELSNDEKLVINIYNQSGETVFTEKVKKFDGKYSEEIDISKEDTGTYFLQKIQGDKSITKKILKK